MRRPIRTRAAVLATAVMTLAGTLAVSPAAVGAHGDVVLTTDFEDGTWAPWSQNGNPTLTTAGDPDDAENQVLLVGDRVDNYDGIGLDLLDHFAPGAAIDVTALSRLVAGEAATSVNFAVEQVVDGATSYPWVGSATLVTEAAWVTIGGDYTLPEGVTAAKLYVQTTAEPHSDLHLDGLVVTGTSPDTAPEVTTVWSLDFDADSHAPWTNNGGTLGYVADGDGGSALSITREQDYHGIKSPVGVLEHDTEYTFSMRARLPEGTAGTHEVRFVVEPDYTWVANTPVDATGWTEVTGTYTVPAGTDPTATALYLGTSGTAGESWTLLVDDLVVTAAGTGSTDPTDPTDPGEVVDLTFGFEDGTLQGWVPRDSGSGAPTLEVTTAQAHSGTQAALVTDRTSQGSGIGYDLTDVFQTGVTYDITAWVRMGDGEAADDIWLSAQTGASTFSTIAQVPGVTSGGWTEVTGTFTMPAGDRAFLYFETNYNTGAEGDFLVDDISIRTQEQGEIQDLLPIKDTVSFPAGVAIDERETFGSAADLVDRHFNQITPENHMKPEAWFDESGQFRTHPQATALMDFAQANDMGLYGHVLVWHSQTPAWFYADEAGVPLTDSAADKQEMRDRLREHIFAVAEALSTGGGYGLYGSDTNPLVAWDVVNEVVSDSGEYADGLRRSEWYRILGEEFIDLAFIYADEAFNDVYAAPGSGRPVTLFINDYNTEQGGKQDRYYALVNRLLDRGVPIDGVGHQFHVSLSMPVAALEAAIVRFQDTGLLQVVTELDVTVGTPVTQANLVEQGYYYRDAFRVFREYADDLYSVTIWGLTDPRSWRSAQAPLAFDGNLQAKPAYYGIVDGDLTPRERTAFVFRGDVAIDGDAPGHLTWATLPLHAIEDVGAFQLRWEPTHLTAYVEVQDATLDTTDALELEYGDTTVTVGRDGSGADATVTEVDGGWVAVVRLPLDPPAAQGDTVAFDVRVIDGASTAGWNTPGALGTLALVEELSYLEAPEAEVAPTIDGAFDDVWETADAVVTDKVVEGDGTGAEATVRTLWQGNTLYVLAEVADDELDVSGSDPWVQDSVEIFLDAGNYKNGPYRYDDTQIRINVDNQVSFGTGDEAFQAARLVSATSVVDGGYVVEVAISLLEEGGLGTFHGLDFQVNDAVGGARVGVSTWADPTGLAYQSTARWGVAQLVAAEDVVTPPVDPGPDPDPVPGTGDGDDNGGAGGGSGGTGGGSGSLPVTGSDPRGLLVVAFLALVLGASMVAVRRASRDSIG